jgi:transcription elongation factor GreA
VRTPTRRQPIQLDSERPAVFLTAEGKASLEAELEDLVNVQRPAIAAAILAAREDGDLRENGAYHDAKDRQGLMEGRIRELKTKLERAQIIDSAATETSDAVILGSTVTILDDAGKEEKFTIVGSMEAKVAAGRISNESPLGRALLGRKPGDDASFTTPNGAELRYKVVAVS